MQWNIVGNRKISDDDTRRMRGGVAGHSFDFLRHINEFPYLPVRIVHGLKFFGFFQSLGNRHAKRKWDFLRHQIDGLIRHAKSSSDVTDSSLGGHSTEGDNLRDMVAAVFADDVVDDLPTALIAKVDIKIRHTDALWVKKTFKQEVILEWVDSGNPHAVGS